MRARRTATSKARAARLAAPSLGLAALLSLSLAAPSVAQDAVELEVAPPPKGQAQETEKPAPDDETASDPIVRKLQEIAARAGPELPRRLDAETVLERISVQGRTLVYRYSATGQDAADEAARAAIRKDVLSKACARALMRDWAESSGVTYRYEYEFPGGAAPVVVEMNAAACRAVDAEEGTDRTADLLQEIVANVSAGLPRKLDPNHTLERVTVEGRTVVHRIRVAQRQVPDPELIAIFRKAIQPSVCGGPKVRDLLDNHGVTYRWIYVVPDSDTPVTIDVDAAACAAKQGTPQKTAETGPQGDPASDPVVRGLREAAAKANTGLPLRMDATKTIERASVEGRMLVYHVRVARRDASDDAFAAEVRRSLTPVYCANPRLREMMDKHGVVYRYSYLFPGSDTPLTVDIDEESCGDG